MEGYLSTVVDLTKQVKPSFALPPTVKCSKTERRKVCVCVYQKPLTEQQLLIYCHSVSTGGCNVIPELNTVYVEIFMVDKFSQISRHSLSALMRLK